MSRFSLLPALAALLLGTAVLRAAEPTISVSEIRPGMRGTAYTVLQGTEIVPIAVEILGVTENSIGPGHDLIIGKLVDPKTALVETVHGMSGSPLYIDGKLAGALSRRLTSFEKDGQCGFTPIADMLRVDALPAAEPEANPGTPAALLQSGGFHPLPTRGPDSAFLDVPLSINGVAPQVLQGLLKTFHLDAVGLLPVAGGAASEARLAKTELKPGSAVAAVLMTGDVSMAGTGTLTWREGNRILAFGHPMMGIGRSSWGMAPAEIVTTIPSYSMPYKLSNTGPIVGAIVQDRLSAVSGIVGATPAMAPYRIERIHDGRAMPPVQGTFSTAPTMAALLVNAAVTGAASDGNELGRTLFLQATGELQLKDLPPLRIDGVYSGEDTEEEAAIASLLEPVRLLYAQDWARPVATGLHLKLETSEVLHLWTVEDAQLDARTYDPGALVTLTVSLRERYGKFDQRRFEFRLPPALKSGSVRVRIADGAALDHASLLKAIPSLDSAAQLVELLNRRRSRDRIYVQLVSDDGGQVIDNQELPALPASVLSLMGKGNRGETPVALRDRVWYETSASLPGAVTGQETLQLDIRP